MPSVYHCDRPKARKEHKCYECGGKIPIGEVYCKHYCVWDGGRASFKVCDDCENLRTEMDSTIDDWDEKTGIGQLYESVFESRDLVTVKRWMDNARKRGAKIPDWQIRVEGELLNAEPRDGGQ